MTADYNRDCDRVVIFCFPPYAGGKFLINLLGLSTGCYLQDIGSLRQQRNKGFSSQDKLDFLLDRLSKERGVWNDLNLGCAQFFGSIHDPKLFYQEIKEVSYEDKLFFVVSHCTDMITDRSSVGQYLNIWPKAKKVYLKNSNGFVNWRMGFDKDFDRSGWPDLPQDFTANQEQQILALDEVYVWDVEWIFDQERFLQELQNLYAHFGLDDFDPTLVKTFYIKYMAKLAELQERNHNLDKLN